MNHQQIYNKVELKWYYANISYSLEHLAAGLIKNFKKFLIFAVS
jgi:hypothetical protein